MSHEKSITNVPLSFKFEAIADDFFTITHNLGDTRPVVEVYDNVTNVRINDAVVEAINANQVTITTLLAQPIRGTIIGSPDPGE